MDEKLIKRVYYLRPKNFAHYFQNLISVLQPVKITILLKKVDGLSQREFVVEYADCIRPHRNKLLTFWKIWHKSSIWSQFGACLFKDFSGIFSLKL